MSKISNSKMNASIEKMLEYSKEHERNFLEAVELQFVLKNYDPAKDKKFVGNIVLPHRRLNNIKVCVFGDVRHCDIAKSLGVDYMTLDDMKKLQKNAKLVKKLAEKYDFFLASDSLIKQVPRLMPTLNRIGKFPHILLPSDDMEKKIDILARTIQFQYKKSACIGTRIIDLSATSEEIAANAFVTINFFASLLKKKWQNIKSVYMKTSMGKPICLL